MTASSGERRRYLDYNATAPVWPSVAAAVAEAMLAHANASSVHREGRTARRALETARSLVAGWLDADPSSVVFTSGGTEANQLAVASHPFAASAVEHPSILQAREDTAVIEVDDDGVVDTAALDGLLRTRPVALVSVMLANNETGVLQPLREVIRIARRHGVLVHCDAVQAVGRLPVRLRDLGVDLMSVSGHKIGGPPGTGALLVRPGLDVRPRQRGGGQEHRRRGGTENLPGIIGLARACEEMRAVDWTRVRAMRNRLEAQVLDADPNARIAGAGAPRLPNTSCIVLPGVPAETQLIALDLAGIAVSVGAACSSGKVEASHVLRAMREPDAPCAVRVSLGWNSRDDDVDAFVAAWRATAERVRARAGKSPARTAVATAPA